LEQELATAQATLQLCEELVTEPVDLRGAVALAAANVDKAAAAHATATTELAIAERELGWATVTAPVDGVVLKLLAEPGDTVGPAAKGIVALYDPNKLRARIDVPLDSIGNVHEGQQVEIRSQATGNTVVRGVVQRLQHESDLLKNTLQVKIGLFDAPALLRPETLCRARFLGGGGDGGTKTVTAFVVPKAAVRQDLVFVFDPALGTAHAVAVKVEKQQGEDVVVRGELSITHKVVLVPVLAGEHLREETR
jgi:RND family efflux transporter MFP subunit